MKRSREYLHSLDSSRKVITYLNKVKSTLRNDKYTIFCHIMTQFKEDFHANRVDFASFVANVKELFKGYDGLILGFDDLLPKKHKIFMKESVQEAVDFVNKVHLRFSHKEHIYKAFLDVLSLCLEGDRSVHYDVYRQVVVLFEDHRDLVKEFERFISVEGFGVASCDDEKEKVSNKKYNRGLDLCEKVQKKLCNSDDYRNFLKCLHYYTTGVISRSDLRCLVADVLEKDAGLVEEFDGFLNSCENDGYQSSKKKRRVEKSIQELDLIQSDDCTPSYWLLPEEYQMPSAGQSDEIGAQVLNDQCVSRGKDISSKPKHIDREEKFRFKCEDVRFELDMLLNSVSSTTSHAQVLLDGITTNEITLETQFDIKKHFTAFNLRYIERLYGDHGREVLDSLHRSPAVALPIMITRLNQKHEELKRSQSDFNKVCADVYAKKDPQQDSKRLSIESLERRVKRIEERIQI